MENHYNLCQISQRRAHCGLAQELKADSEMPQAKPTLERSLEQRETPKLDVGHGHDPFFNRLPVELASRIFSSCLPPLPTINNFRRKGSHVWVPTDTPEGCSFRVQLWLGAVCRYWRQILWSNPRFWNMIHLALSPRSPLHLGIVLEDWVRRSRDLPLYIQILFREERDSKKSHSHPIDIPNLLTSITATLNACIHRWFLVSFTLPSAYMSMLGGNLETSTITQGLALQMSLVDPDNESLGAILIRIRQGSFNTSPMMNPQVLSLTHFTANNVSIDFTNLTLLHACHMGFLDCAEIIRCAPQLTKCVLESVDDMEAAPPHILHNSLRKLVIFSGEVTIYDGITCPNLQELTQHDDSDGIIPDNLPEFIRRSMCPLVSFNIMVENSDTEQQDLVKLLRLMPSLQRLEVSSANDEVFKYLGETTYVNQNDVPSAFLPHLRWFRYSGKRAFHWSSVQFLTPTTPPQPNMHRRPLYDIRLRVAVRLHETHSGYEETLDIIDEQSLRGMLAAKQQGFKITVETAYASQSLIDASLKSYTQGTL